MILVPQNAHDNAVAIPPEMVTQPALDMPAQPARKLYYILMFCGHSYPLAAKLIERILAAGAKESARPARPRRRHRHVSALELVEQHGGDDLAVTLQPHRVVRRAEPKA